MTAPSDPRRVDPRELVSGAEEARLVLRWVAFLVVLAALVVAVVTFTGCAS